MDIRTKIIAARTYGSVAFANGKDRAPACDVECMKLLTGVAVGGVGSEILRAWVDGWTAASLAA
jgi:hypothetical protein